MTERDPNPLSSGDLAAFLAAVETGAVHAAADAFGLSASAVSKRIQALERRLDVRLFERGRLGLEQTEAARLLYPEAKQALLALDSAKRVLSGPPAESAQAIELAASHTIGDFLLPRWLAGFRALHPEVRAKVDVVNSEAVLAALAERRVEIGFVEGPDPPTGLETIDIYRDRLVVVVIAGHRWAGRREVEAAELRTEPYLSRERGSGTRAVAARALARAGVELTPALEAASTQSVRRALGDNGFAVLSLLSVEAGGEAASLRTLDVRGVDMTRELRAVREPRRRLDAPARRFWSWLRAQVKPIQSGNDR